MSHMAGCLPFADCSRAWPGLKGCLAPLYLLSCATYCTGKLCYKLSLLQAGRLSGMRLLPRGWPILTPTPIIPPPSI